MVSPTRWALINYAHRWEADTLHVWLQTDRTCHLWLRFTSHTERLHLHEARARGYNWITDPKYCFVQWQEVEQNEPGDTVQHTFTFAGWAPCERRWWHFRGEIGGQPSPSNTAIVSAHYLDQEKAMAFKHTELEEKELAGIIDHADDSITAPKLAHNIDAQPIDFNADKVDGQHASAFGIPNQSFSVRSTVPEVIPHNTLRKRFWNDVAEWDDWVGWAPVFARLYIWYPGKYLIHARIAFEEFPADATYVLYIAVNDILVSAIYQTSPVAGVISSAQITTFLDLAYYDFIEVFLYHLTGVDRTLQASDLLNEFSVQRVA